MTTEPVVCLWEGGGAPRPVLDGRQDVWEIVCWLASGYPAFDVSNHVMLAMGRAPSSLAAVRCAVATAREWVDAATRMIEEGKESDERNAANEAARRFTQRTGVEVTDELLLFALAICERRVGLRDDGSAMTISAPAGAPAPLDWSVWAHRVLDRPMEFLSAPDRRGRRRRVWKDPWSLLMLGERGGSVRYPLRRWDPHLGWRGRPEARPERPAASSP